MIFVQLAGVATLFAKFHAGTKRLFLDFWPPLLEQPIKLVLVGKVTSKYLHISFFVYSRNALIFPILVG